jgi:AcrR family transcriptional regulator
VPSAPTAEQRRTGHDRLKARLLEAAADYVLAHGLARLSIRPLAAAIGLSHRTLLYHFESKEKLLLQILDMVRDRDRATIRAYLAATSPTSVVQLFRAAWHHFSAADRMPYIRFFHEVFALGLQGPPYSTWAATVADSRIAMITAALTSGGIAGPRARALATLITSTIRGLQLHLITTGDRATTDAAFEEFLTTFEPELRGGRPVRPAASP